MPDFVCLGVGLCVQLVDALVEGFNDGLEVCCGLLEVVMGFT
jgi:hypothetical protein